MRLARKPHAVSWTDRSQIVPARAPHLAEIFLLLPRLDEMPLSEATRDWPHADGGGGGIAGALAGFAQMLRPRTTRNALFTILCCANYC